ncbi:gamma-glutamyltransferase [Candidatus Falkowbacteria bacterium]|jgi:gamma-glutamyltranspeptidase / glutathione hydrolase|nr:gamma-glutamyltransferase [Candidatus Falkowbacteria bacterium]MBT4433164.1 gamma-glutamyltransferase [Candidatus Falkowbacteria bacterium]
MANKKGVVSAGHIKTAEAGRLILEEGGNAFDAAIGAGLASCVAEYMLTSLGGGGFLLAHTKDKQNTLFDFFTQTPGSKKINGKPDFYPVEIDFGDVTQEFHVGLGSMAVPGNVAGFFHVHKKLGRLPFEVVADPAIEYAKKGLELNSFQHYCLTLLGPIMTSDKETKAIFESNGNLIKAKELCKMTGLADTLDYLSREGTDAFYKGEIASQLIKDSKEKGGYLTKEDLENYKVIERDPLKINYRGNEIITNPPPSSGGALIAFALELLESIDFSKIKHGSFEHLKILADVMRITNLARQDSYDDNLYNKDVIEKFLGSKHVEKYKDILSSEINKWGSTTHLSVIDAEGNAATMTTSNGEGSSYVIPGTGVMMNNMLGEEDVNPLGFHKWKENIRISSMMSPTMVLKNDCPEAVLGSGGSNRIRTAILQVISNIIDFKMHVSEAVDSPRIHWERNSFNIEPGFDKKVIEKIKKISRKDKITEFSEKNMFFGGAHTTTYQDKKFDGAGDKRRSGVALDL